MLVIPGSAIGSDQQGDYVYVVGRGRRRGAARDRARTDHRPRLRDPQRPREGPTASIVNGILNARAGEKVAPTEATPVPAPTAAACQAVSRRRKGSLVAALLGMTMCLRHPERSARDPFDVRVRLTQPLVLAKFFIERPVLANVIAFVTILLGAVAAAVLPVSQYPPITPPTVQVTTTYPGASAKTLVETVALPIEQQVNGVEKMLYMQSNSTSDGRYTLTVTFQVGTDLDFAQVLVQNRVSAAMAQLPGRRAAAGRRHEEEGDVAAPDHHAVVEGQPLRRALPLELRDAAALRQARAAAGRRRRRRLRRRRVQHARLARPAADVPARPDADRRRQRAAGRERLRRGGPGRHAADAVGPGVPADGQRPGGAVGPDAVRPDHPEDRRERPDHADPGRGPRRARRAQLQPGLPHGRPPGGRHRDLSAPGRERARHREGRPQAAREPRAGLSAGIGVRGSVRHDDVCEGVGQRRCTTRCSRRGCWCWW